VPAPLLPLLASRGLGNRAEHYVPGLRKVDAGALDRDGVDVWLNIVILAGHENGVQSLHFDELSIKIIETWLWDDNEIQGECLMCGKS